MEKTANLEKKCVDPAPSTESYFKIYFLVKPFKNVNIGMTEF